MPARHRIPRSERVLVRDRPHWLFVLTGAWKWIVLGVLLWSTLTVLNGRTSLPYLGTLAWVVVAVVLLRLIVGAYDWMVRQHILTDARIIAQFGILRTVRTDLPLRRVQHLVLVRPLIERLFGLGSIGVASAGTGSIEVVWRGVDRPKGTLEQIRKQIARAVEDRDELTETVVVIGLVGGVGSGKSTVAEALGKHGCLVSDSDEAVGEVLMRPEVIDRLVSWWGERVLNADGRINRSAVADIVFDEPDERYRLEELIHPLIRESRRALIRQAEATGAAGVVIDAPLLYEAGVDSECDTVVFVDTPVEIRQRRVKQSRGWDADELDRRERAQMSIADKRRKADWTISNAGDENDLGTRALELLRDIQSQMSNPAPRG